MRGVDRLTPCRIFPDAAEPAVRAVTTADGAACIAIIRGLPDYFTDDVADTVRADLATHAGWVVTTGDDGIAGFAVVRHNGAQAAEILWAAVAPERRNQGLGTRLINHVLGRLRDDGVRLVEVKTLDPSAGYAPYVATHAFWVARGFVQIDIIDPLPGWQPGNPSAILVTALASTR